MSSFRSRRRRAGFEPIHRWAECELPQTGANFALRVDLLLDHRLGCLRDGYGISVSVHYLPGAVFGSEDHRNPQIAWGDFFASADLRVGLLYPHDTRKLWCHVLRYDLEVVDLTISEYGCATLLSLGDLLPSTVGRA